jgi:hypothetical protein
MLSEFIRKLKRKWAPDHDSPERWLQMFECATEPGHAEITPSPYSNYSLWQTRGKGRWSAPGLPDKKNPNNLDIENFGTYPAKLMGVQLRSQ